MITFRVKKKSFHTQTAIPSSERDRQRDIPPPDKQVGVLLLIGRHAPGLMRGTLFRSGRSGTPWVHKLSLGWTIIGQTCPRWPGPHTVATQRTVISDTPTSKKTYTHIYRQTTTK